VAADAFGHVAVSTPGAAQQRQVWTRGVAEYRAPHHAEEVLGALMEPPLDGAVGPVLGRSGD
jgi:hypothetical protein